MKIKEGFVLREIAGNLVVFPVGEASVDFNGMLSLNETGAYLWEKLTEEKSLDNLENDLCSEYNVDRETARADIELFIEKLKEIGCLEG